MIVFDTEDNSPELMLEARRALIRGEKPDVSGFDKELTQIAAINDEGETFHNAGHVGEFLSWIENQGETDLWAHMAQYDLGNICHSGEMDLDGWDLLLVGGRFIRGSNSGMRLCDSLNLWPMRLKELGKNIGLEKGRMDVRSKEYVFRDCEIVMQALKHTRSLCHEFGIKRLPSTLGGLTVKLFDAMEFDQWFCADQSIKTAYYGGRVELFCAGGTGNILYCDINSLYPYAMSLPMPDGIEPLTTYKYGWGVCDAKIEIPQMHVCPLPVRRDDSSIYYPYGTIDGSWTFHEIRNAERLGCRVLGCSNCRGSLQARPYYREFLGEMYRRRLKSETGAEKLQWKLILNNLYGRLAIGGVVTRSCLLNSENMGDEGIIYGSRILSDYAMPLPDFTNYLHAAYVTSYARLILYRYLSLIPKESLIYCDTDSVIFFWPDDNPPFPISKALGKMKLESIGNRCEVFAPKTYLFSKVTERGTKTQWKAKGVPKKRAARFVTDSRAEFDLPFKLREAISFYDRGNAKKLSVWRNVEKLRRSEYDKKQFDGRYYHPLRSNA